jgi:methylated-DNA-[protein]-cysteine S-methyltransferase
MIARRLHDYGDDRVYTWMASPVGELLLAGRDAVLEVIGFPSGRMAMSAQPGWQRDDAAFAEARRQLGEYFAGQRRDFDLPVAPRATPFQARVLAALRRIPYGETRSYKQIAEAIGEPKAVRAVGGANGSNPLPIVIPCHRVIGSGGQLTGFGGGIDTKRFLLDLERRHSGLFAGS